MKLYHWTSYTFKDYALGNIVCMAPSLEEARKKVLDHYKDFPYLSEIKSDISSDPMIIDAGVIEFAGSA